MFLVLLMQFMQFMLFMLFMAVPRVAPPPSALSGR